ncbi:MFS transporter [Alicyclobacillus fastidiosus]|uniref:MFS transporter n=1 Tax=Alicyclobacillus fastidiosus TaxID=392011 RepID=A0ABY6ZK56_9BACL|nr:MFS transporter [Alicyclobacillus fastidiosus]WAH43180.1 MFS transporter [Alicyclobacillus fastidiosus]GMA65203.1 MFS transporter [Alicyclobacillus fastidiosus]
MSEVVPNRYQNALMWMLFLMLGFVFFDRLTITYLMPIIAPKLHVDNAQVGQISMWMTLAWDASALVFGMLSDKSGVRKRWLIPFIICTAVFSGFSAVAVSFSSLLLIRILNGLGEGPTFPLSMSMLAAASDERRLGRNIGFAQSGTGLIGMALAPLVVTQVAVHFNWHVAFVVSGIPTLVMALVMWKWAKEVRFAASATKMNVGRYMEALKYRNVSVSVLVSICLMIALWVMNIFAPLFLTNVDHLTESQMGYVMAIMGLGAFFWGFVVPFISDVWGRKPTVIVFSFLSIFPPLVMHFYHGNWVILAVVSFFLNVVQGVFPLMMNIIPMETVPRELAATAGALSMSVGEIIGAALTPAIAGALADHYGLPIVMYIAAAGPFVATFVGFAFKESRVRRTRETNIEAQASEADYV